MTRRGGPACRSGRRCHPRRATRSAERVPALVALEALSRAPEGLEELLALLLHRRRDRLDAHALEHLPRTSHIDGETLVRRLLFWRDKPAAALALAGAPPHLYWPFAQAFGQCHDAELEERAIRYIETTRRQRSTWMIGGFLAALGELPAEGDPSPAFRSGARVLRELARRQQGLELQRDGQLPLLPDTLLDAPDDVRRLQAALQMAARTAKSGLPPALAGLAAPDASLQVSQLGDASRADRGNRRGAVGELLRLRALQDAPANRDRLVIRGLLLVSAPLGLRQAESYEEALAWCAAQEPPIDEKLVARFETTEGSLFGLMRTEMDLSVFMVRGGKLAPVRMENVKVGLGASSEARGQNKVALEVLAGGEEACVLLRRPGQPDLDLRPLLDLSPRALTQLELVTVGPKDDPAYDQHLPLTGWDLSQLSLRL